MLPLRHFVKPASAHTSSSWGEGHSNTAEIFLLQLQLSGLSAEAAAEAATSAAAFKRNCSQKANRANQASSCPATPRHPNPPIQSHPQMATGQQQQQ